MLSMILAILVWLPALVGLGSILLRSDRSWGKLGLTGLLLLALAGLVLNFFIPLSTPVGVVFLAVGWTSFVFKRKVLSGAMGTWEWAGLGSLVVGYAFFAVCVTLNFDTGYYHLPSVTWNRLSAVPFGLANVSAWFGYNSISFIAEALLFLPGLEHTATFAFNPLLAIFFFHLLFCELLEWGKRDRRVTWLTALCVVPFIIGGHFSADVGLISPNYAARIFLLFAWCLILKGKEEEDLSTTDVALIVAASLAGTMAKTFGLVTTAANLVLLTWVVFRYTPASGRTTLVKAGVVAGLALGLPWVARNFVLSGCAIFPQDWLCLPNAAWRVPSGDIAETVSNIRSLNESTFNQSSGLFTSYLAVLKIHWTRFYTSVGCLIAIGVVSAIIRRAITKRDLIFGLLACFLHILGFVFWLSFAPSFPFIVQNIVAILALALGAGFMGGQWMKRFPAPTLALVAILFSLAHNTRTAWGTHTNALAWIRWPTISEPALVERKLSSGLPFYVATERMCWSSRQLPCSEVEPPRLAGRRSPSGRFHFSKTPISP